MCNARKGRMESQGAGSCCPSTAGLPKEQHGPAVPTLRSSALVCGMQMSFCRCKHCEYARKTQPEIFLWSQWIIHILEALISLLRQTACSSFHTKRCEIASADCLGLLSDRKRRRAEGLVIRSVQTDTGNSEQISHRGMWIVWKRKKPLVIVAWQILVILQDVS